MWRSSKASDRGRNAAAAPAADPRAGFSLIEVLVAIVIASLMVTTLSRALSGAWAGARAPADTLAAVTVARGVIGALRAEPDSIPTAGPGRAGDYRYEVTTRPALIEYLRPPVPPAPLDGAAKRSEPQAAGAGGSAAPPARPAAAPTPPPQPVDIAVVVTTPSGRSVRLETAKLLPAR
ncbi:type IV pilus modification PilV family protein [Prosthecomicrobium sp. N25]|uniref:type IV pilus modification PilV family protein n=1 Tax=Prosthecomicrobium sp. N25 TaxID=3129254 RepID=UPI00307881C3